MTNEYDRPTTPRTGDGSLPAEDDALLQQPRDEVIDDPDTEGPGGIGQEERPNRPDQPAEGPDDPSYTER